MTLSASSLLEIPNTDCYRVITYIDESMITMFAMKES